MSYKIYVHHNYNYEYFWYFFHGVDVDIDKVITHVNKETAFNKKIPITSNVTIKCNYNSNELEIHFVGDSNWESSGHHIFDYSIWLLDEKLASDRGFNSNIMGVIDNSIIPKLNKFSKYPNTKYHFFYIDWEGHSAYFKHEMATRLNKNINVYVDEYPVLYSYPNSFYTFTNVFMSFIYPNTLGLREYYFFHDILKYKKNFKHRINLPIRRLYGNKISVYQKSKDLKNINITHSSFHDTKQYSNDQVGGWRTTMIETIGDENIIEKRGYGINDWGGEWNDDNVNEMMWRLFDIADVNILPEYSYTDALTKEDNPNKIGTHFITEKTVSHVLAGKPFIPFYYDTIWFYDTILKENGFEPKPYPLEYKKVDEILEKINTLADNESTWQPFLHELTEWVLHTRESIVKIVDTKNHFLDILLKSNYIKTNNLL